MSGSEKLSIETQMIVLNFIGNVPSKTISDTTSTLSSPGSQASECQCDIAEVPDCYHLENFNQESLLKIKSCYQRPNSLKLQGSFDLPDHTSPSETSTALSNGSRTSILDLNVTEVEELVQTSSIPWYSSPLQKELKSIESKLKVDQKLIIGEKRFRKTERYSTTPQKRKLGKKLSLEVESPEAEVAKALAAIGDEIMVQFGDKVSAVIDDILLKERENLTYNIFKNYATNLIAHCVSLSNLRKATLILLLSQHLAFRLIQKGEKNLNDLIQFTATLVLDYSRDYLEKLGNSWQATILEENEGLLSDPGSGNTVTSRKSSTGFFPINDTKDEVDLSYSLNVTNGLRSRISSDQLSENEYINIEDTATASTSRSWRNWMFWTAVCATGAFLTGFLIQRKK